MMNEAKAKKVVIANSDDKRQITAVLAATNNPYVCYKIEVLQLQAYHQALAITDCFKNQTTPRILSQLCKNSIRPFVVPANCTDKL